MGTGMAPLAVSAAGSYTRTFLVLTMPWTDLTLGSQYWFGRLIPCGGRKQKGDGAGGVPGFLSFRDHRGDQDLFHSATARAKRMRKSPMPRWAHFRMRDSEGERGAPEMMRKIQL